MPGYKCAYLLPSSDNVDEMSVYGEGAGIIGEPRTPFGFVLSPQATQLMIA